MAQKELITTNHDVIRKWAEERKGFPAVVKGTEGTEDMEPDGILRIDFGEENERLKRIEWDEFFRVFEERKLAFVYEEKTADGKPGRICKFMAREEEMKGEEV